MLATLNQAVKSQKCEFIVQITKHVKCTNQNYCFMCIYVIYIYSPRIYCLEEIFFWTPSWKIYGGLATVHNLENIALHGVFNIIILHWGNVRLLGMLTALG